MRTTFCIHNCLKTIHSFTNLWIFVCMTLGFMRDWVWADNCVTIAIILVHVIMGRPLGRGPFNRGILFILVHGTMGPFSRGFWFNFGAGLWALWFTILWLCD